MPLRLRFALPACLAVGLIVTTNAAWAAEVWSGLTYSFTRPDGVDGTLPENQDLITPNVIFARQDIQGLYNAASESGYTGGLSPEFTEWATGLMDANTGLTIEATNYAALTFDDWTAAYVNAVGGHIVGERAVVHLIAEDIYLDIEFTSWAVGRTGGQGGFSYMRAEPPVAEPSGDYNGDGTVNAADYTVWRDTLGQTVASPGDGADGDLSGVIDLPDYDHWKAHFGNLAGAGGAAVAVPEPTTGVLFAIASLLIAAARPSHCHRHTGNSVFKYTGFRRIA